MQRFQIYEEEKKINSQTHITNEKNIIPKNIENKQFQWKYKESWKNANWIENTNETYQLRKEKKS